MRSFLLLILVSTGLHLSGQEQSDLYLKVDSLIKYELKYTFDSTSDTRRVVNRKIGSNPHPLDILHNPSPRIVLDGVPIERQNLLLMELVDVERVQVIQGDDPMATALWGASGRNGVLLITTRK